MPAEPHLPVDPRWHTGPYDKAAVLIPGSPWRRLLAILGLPMNGLPGFGIVLFFLVTALRSFAQTSPATLPNVPFATTGNVLTLALQDDGKVILGGYFVAVNGL